MKPEAIIIILGILLLLTALISWFLSRFERRTRLYLFMCIVVICSGYYLFLFLANKPVLPTEESQAYAELLELLARAYQESSTWQPRGYMLLQQPVGGELGETISQLRIECLLYVHDQWRGNEQRGLVVSGKSFGDFQPLWRFEIVRSYTITGDRFSTWRDKERPDISFEIGSFLERHPPSCYQTR